MNAPYRAVARGNLQPVPHRKIFRRPPPAPAPEPVACYPDFLALDIGERFLPGTPSRFSHTLSMRRGDRLFASLAAFEARFDGRTLETGVTFRDTAGVSPYLVHALLITGDDAVYGCHDLTSVGTAPPARILPGESFAFPKCHLPQTGPLDCRFLLWGTL